ncbi:MAG: acetyl-CoA acetyltransferase [Pseudonocardiaceae bacterium]|nr:MAG: acetyl-CoA acetyltransferase [Pseudonocardiaceae bacterium]
MREVAVAGVGYTPFTRASGRPVLDLACDAALAACADAGLDPALVDGVGTHSAGQDSEPAQAVATALALPGLRWVVDLAMAGQAPCHLVGLAADAVATGRAEAVLVFRALNGRSGAKVGSARFPGRGGPYRYPIGYGAYPMYIATWANRHLHETGQTTDDLGAVAVAHRRYAVLNDRAVVRTPLDLAGHRASPWVAEPFRVADCTREVDGACALLVTTLERARDLRRPPAVVAAAAYRAGPRPGLDLGDHVLTDDYTRNFTDLVRDELFGRAGVTPADVDVAELYDCFSSVVLMSLEGLGLCARGAAGELVRSEALPVNTHGGLLGEGYLHGMNTVAEAVLQVQGRGGVRQSARHDVVVATSGALMDGSALVLTRDR